MTPGGNDENDASAWALLVVLLLSNAHHVSRSVHRARTQGAAPPGRWSEDFGVRTAHPVVKVLA